MFQTVDFVEQFSIVLVAMLSKQLSVAAVTSDGYSFQRKPLHWRDPNSLKFQFPDFAKMLFAPGIYHRVQNATMTLHDRNRRYPEIFNQTREVAGILRQLRNREVLGFICPGQCPTRWVYDYLIVRFTFNHFEDAHALFAGEGFDLDEDIKFLIPLLEQLFVTVRTPECDNS
jgi:hypothetical protein